MLSVGLGMLFGGLGVVLGAFVYAAWNMKKSFDSFDMGSFFEGHLVSMGVMAAGGVSFIAGVVLTILSFLV